MAISTYLFVQASLAMMQGKWSECGITGQSRSLSCLSRQASDRPNVQIGRLNIDEVVGQEQTLPNDFGH